MSVSVVGLEEVLHGSVRRYPCVTALGTFDGVHQGHMSILRSTHTLAQKLGARSIAFTFDRLPLEALRPEQAPPLITLPEARFSLLAQVVDEVIVIPFTQQLTHMDAAAFVQQVLIEGLGVVGIVAGYNYTFGRGALGSAASLQELATKHSLEVMIIPPVQVAGQQISSTLIRQHISAGEVTQAHQLLGRPFRLMGQVVSGDARGRVLGYPTANLKIDTRLVTPGPGVYVTVFRLAKASSISGQETHLAVTAVSDRPTFSGEGLSVESFVLDYDNDLYGEVVYLDFYHRLRDIRKFADAAALTEQIKTDVAFTRTYAEQYLCG